MDLISLPFLFRFLLLDLYFVLHFYFYQWPHSLRLIVFSFFFFGKAPLDVHCFFVFLIICILKSLDNHIFICPAFSVRERWCVSVPCSAAHVSQ